MAACHQRDCSLLNRMRGESTHCSARATDHLPCIRITHFKLIQGETLHGCGTAQVDPFAMPTISSASFRGGLEKKSFGGGPGKIQISSGRFHSFAKIN